VHSLEIGDGHTRVDLRGLNRRVTQHFLQMPDRAFGEQSSAAPREVFVPALSPWVKQRDDVTGLRDDSGKIRSLVTVAVTTGEGPDFLAR
jgi:hypothetical protein